MDKRQFLAAAAVAASLPARAVAAPKAATGGGPVLTVSGAIGKSNRGPFDPALDQLMKKHAIQFDKAWTFDAATIAKLPALTIEPTIEYDAKRHRMQGPLLETLLQAAGVPATANVLLGLRAVDGYIVMVSLADARRYKMMVATRMDGQPLALGSLGPLWVTYDADNLPAFKDKPLKERFGLSPWGMYHIDVRPA